MRFGLSFIWKIELEILWFKYLRKISGFNFKLIGLEFLVFIKNSFRFMVLFFFLIVKDILVNDVVVVLIKKIMD